MNLHEKKISNNPHDHRNRKTQKRLRRKLAEKKTFVQAQ